MTTTHQRRKAAADADPSLCTRCNARKSDLRYKMCADCRARRNAEQKARYATDETYANAQRTVARERVRNQTPEQRAARLERLRRAGRGRKTRAIAAYGGACACCGESAIEFLTLHHVEGNGNLHRLELTKHARAGGGAFYHQLERHGYPQDVGLSVLCWNCHMAIEYYGACAHAKEDEQATQASDETKDTETIAHPGAVDRERSVERAVAR